MVQRDDPECPNPPQEGTNIGLNDGYGPVVSLNPDSEITLQDLLNNPSLDEAIHKKMVTRLAQALASLKAEPWVGFTQTLNGSKCFEKDEWFTGASQAKVIGANIGLVDADGSPVVLFTKEGEAYIRAASTSESTQWLEVNLGETEQMMPLGVEVKNKKGRGGGLMQSLLGKADLMRGIAAGATEPVDELKGFLTTEYPFTTLPTLEMSTNGDILLRPGKKLVGVTIALAGTPFSIVATKGI